MGSVTVKVETKRDADISAMDVTEIEKATLRRAPDCISAALEGETVILDIQSGVYSGLNEVGTFVWNLLEKQVTFAEIREAILAEFDVTFEECSANLLSFLKELEHNKLIEARVEANT